MYPIISEGHTETSDIRYRAKNEYGQVLNMYFYIEQIGINTEWWITFWIGKRKRGFQELTQTGKDGIKSLLWAKECIKDFIKNLDRSHDHKIFVHWDDNRRRDVYARGLKELGFDYKPSYKGKKMLVLTIDKD